MLDLMKMKDAKNMKEEMETLFKYALDLEVDIDGGEDMPDTYTLTSCRVMADVNDEWLTADYRPATDDELDYFNSNFASEIEDYGIEYWYEKCF